MRDGIPVPGELERDLVRGPRVVFDEQDVRHPPASPLATLAVN